MSGPPEIPGIKVRPATADDLPFLKTMLADAARGPAPAARGPAARWPSVEACLADRPVSRFWTGWPRPDDLGVVAHSEGSPVGATWARRFPPDALAQGEDAEAPQLVIAVEPAWRLRGIGRMLLLWLMVQASERRVAAVELTVSMANGTALRLFRSVGFADVGHHGDAVHMRRQVRRPGAR